jgi:TfoX/Sxy family transcriptional regulator of competence genes
MCADTMRGAGRITFKKMFGEYGIYCDGTLVALACDNRLFVKPTEAGRAILRRVVEAPPYPGAKAAFVVEDGIDDPEYLAHLIRVTREALARPGPKRRR